MKLNTDRQSGEPFNLEEAKAESPSFTSSNPGNDECLEFRLRFESLLAEISARFVNLPADRIDAEIEDAQRLICESLDLDLSSLWQWSDNNPLFMNLTHLHSPPPPDGPERPASLNAQETFPWTVGRILKKEILARSTEKMPPEAALDQENLRFYGVKSSVVFPLYVGGMPVFGVLSFDNLRKERTLPDSMVKRLQLLAQIFANALGRKHTDLELRESEARLRLATNTAGIGLWSMEIDFRHVWVTHKTRELFHFAEDEDLSFERFMGKIDPADRERVEKKVLAAIESGEQLKIEYRIILPDGSIRWIYSGGQGHFKPDGGPGRLMGVSIDISRRKQMDEKLRMQLEEIKNLKQKLEMENIYLQKEVELQHVHAEIVGQSRPMREVLKQVEQVARTDATVLIQGETGVGKELLARAVHRLSERKSRPLVTVNCASLPPTLIESELFGREKGAYTGAMTRMTGRFETADEATLFLDEIGELPQEVQSKLLRVLEQGRFQRLGSSQSLQVNARIIAATNRDLGREASDGKFRKDLYYRLNVFPITIPPLRERPEDIPLLVWAFIRQFQKKMGKRIDHIPRKNMDDLCRYPWPGNARELRNTIEHAMIVSSGKILDARPPRASAPASEISEDLSLEEVERRHIRNVLEKSGWRLSGPGGAGEILGLKRTTLQSKMKKLCIQRPAS